MPSIGPHPAPRWSLPDRPDLEWLAGRAKRLRRSAGDGDPEALALVAGYDPGDGPVTLARAQRVLARAFGFAGWSRLREHVLVRQALTRDIGAAAGDESAADRFLRLAAVGYADPALGDPQAAAAVLRADPSLASAGGAGTLAVAGRSDALRALLARDPAAATRESGPHRWPPILWLAYGRLGLAAPDLAGDPVATLRVLLDAGADPDSGFLWHGLPSAFTAVTGVLGGGERDEPPHPQAVPLAELLLDAGADPNDNQAFYNRQFRPDDAHLGPLLGHGAGLPRASVWRDRLGSAYPTPEQMLGEHLRMAAAYGFVARVRTLLAHGVDPATTGYHPIHGDLTPRELAVRHGHDEVVELIDAAL